ncbi:hypothetical protein OSB04_027953 [Centaurea solstitialis]|uniref:eRF1/Pelota-like N-terminal domain-containing protein n=1 Tax=Centaurea solstitialis TaxID=347529 RepID=A0AA38VX73_9ASTR|nr:hypothetical protein OSB04_027953 [Centaurea solstitialis]
MDMDLKSALDLESDLDLKLNIDLVDDRLTYLLWFLSLFVHHPHHHLHNSDLLHYLPSPHFMIRKSSFNKLRLSVMDLISDCTFLSSLNITLIPTLILLQSCLSPSSPRSTARIPFDLIYPMMADAHDTDKNIEIWKIKKLIKALEAVRGNGTSMISLIMPPRDQVSRVAKMLGDEFGTASNIKSRVNRQSVLGAITSAQQRLKLYNKVPPNGLVLYTGTIVTEDGKEKKVTIDFEPFRPINASLYLCDNRFHTEALHELLESDEKFGFIVMDGNGTLFGTLSGNTREVLHRFRVDLPKHHGSGGQSASRFARLRMEKRHNYVRKTAELATRFFINPATSQPNVSGLILAGSADFKTVLSQSDMFDSRLQAKILNIIDVAYGGEDGFNQAIKLSAEILANVEFIQEKRLIGKYLEEIDRDTGKYVCGVDDTMKAFEMGAVETLIVWENLDINRDPTTDAELEAQDKISLVEWFANEYRKFGCMLRFVTNRSQEGTWFCRGLGGIGGILRYQLDMRAFDDDELSDDDDIYEDSE